MEDFAVQKMERGRKPIYLLSAMCFMPFILSFHNSHWRLMLQFDGKEFSHSKLEDLSLDSYCRIQSQGYTVAEVNVNKNGG